jgi:beta-phosphoglucomutase
MAASMQRYDAILFDFDGVLVDSEPLHFKCLQPIMAEFGIALSWDLYARCIGVAGKRVIERLCALSAPAIPFEKLLEQYSRKQQRFLELAQQGISCEPATKVFLQSLASKLSLAVVTSSPRDPVTQILSSAGILEFFAAMVCSEDVSRHKPDPAPYIAAAALLGAKNPLVVEDSAAGVQSGRAAGFDVAVI